MGRRRRRLDAGGRKPGLTTVAIILLSLVSAAHGFLFRRRSTSFLPFSWPHHPSSSAIVLWMGKGDGKKKRKKKTSPSVPSPTASPAAAAADDEPRRVTTSINVPVREQIKWAQYNKQQAARQSQTSFRQKRRERTKYRRVWDQEEIEQKAMERKRRGQDPDWDVILNRTATAPLVIVDGYNIIHKWPRLKKHMRKGDTQRARQLLVDDLENLQSLKGWRIEVVFDGTKRSTVGPLGHAPGNNKPTPLDQAARKTVSSNGVRTVFSGVGIEADSYIEERCAQAKKVTDGETTGSFIVASDDSMIRLAGQSAGALCMGADRFVTELKAVKRGVEDRVEAAVARVNNQPVRPKELRSTYFHTFGRNSVLVEDKRKIKKERKQNSEAKKNDTVAAVVFVDDDTENQEVPWWAQMPNRTKTYR